jgi:hypothetical protein
LNRATTKGNKYSFWGYEVLIRIEAITIENIAGIWENEVAIPLPALVGYFLARGFSNSPRSVFLENEVISDEIL